MKTPAGRAATQIVMNEFFRNRQEQLMGSWTTGSPTVDESVAERDADLHRHRAAHPRAEPKSFHSKIMALIDDAVDNYRNQTGEDVRPVTIRADLFPLPDLGGSVMTAISAPAHHPRAPTAFERSLLARHRARPLRRRSASSVAAAPTSAMPRTDARRARHRRPRRDAAEARAAIGTAAAMSSTTDGAPSRRNSRPSGAGKDLRSAATSASSGPRPPSATSPTASAAWPCRSSRSRSPMIRS